MDPITPAAPVSTPDTPVAAPPLGRTLFMVVLMVIIALVVAAAAAAFVVHETMLFMEHEVAAQREWMEQRSADTVEAVQKITDEIQVPPNNDKLFTILSKGVGFTEDEYRTDATGAAPEAAFTTDLTAVQQTDAYTQEALISNTDLTTPALHYLCVRPISWAAAGATCTLKCAASGITCSGAATDGLRLSPGQMISRRWDGTNCVCVMGSVNPTAYQTERVIR